MSRTEVRKPEIDSERFWSRASAERNATKLRKLGYQTEVKYALYCDGRSDWTVRSWWEA